MKYLLIAALALTSCSHPPPERTIAWQFNQIEYRSEVVKWKVKEAEVQVSLDEGVINKTAADLEKTTKAWKRARALCPISAMAESEYDIAKADYIAAQLAYQGAKLTAQQDKYKLEEMKTIYSQAKLLESKDPEK